MITLSLEKNSAACKTSSSAISAASLAPDVTAIDAGPADLPKPGFGSAALPLPNLTKAELKSAAKPTSHGRKFGLSWLQIGRAKKRLQTLETVSLGDKRFIALVRVDDRQFLIGGAPSNVGLLTELAQEESFHQVLNEATEGMNVSLSAAATKPADPASPTDEAISPVLQVKQADPVTALPQARSEASLPVTRIEKEAAAQPATAFDEAFMRAYRDIAFAAAAGAISGPDTPLDSLQGRQSNTAGTASLRVSEPISVRMELPTAEVHAQPALEPEAVPQSDRMNEPIESPAATPPGFSPVPSFTFQSPSPRVSKQPEKPKAAISVRPALSLSGFTWSLTGATS